MLAVPNPTYRNQWLPGDTAIQARAHEITKLLSDLSVKERTDYSICRAILARADERRADASFELELSEAISAKLGRPTSGIYIPTRLKASGLDTKTNAAGAYTVATEVKDLIEILRNRCQVIRMGATVLGGLQGNIQFPRESSASSGSWVAQNPGSDVSDSDAAFSAVSMSPKTYQASTSYSRQFLAQSTIDAEAFVRNDLGWAHALAIDLAAINGSGANNQPRGILNTTGIGSVAIGQNGGAPTAGFIVDLETAIASANADVEKMGYLTTPVMRGKLRKIGKLDSVYASVPLWESRTGEVGAGDLNGYVGRVSNQVPSNLVKGTSSDCHAIVFGDWANCVVGEWGVIEIIVDPFRLKKAGMIELTSFQLCDIGIRQPAGFAAILDARNI